MIDEEWVALIIEALSMGITEEEIREYFEGYGDNNEEASD